MKTLVKENLVFESFKKYIPSYLSICNYDDSFLHNLLNVINSSKLSDHILNELSSIADDLERKERAYELILVGNLIIDLTNDSSYSNKYYIWKAYYIIGRAYLSMELFEYSLDAFEKSLQYIDTSDEITLEYTHSLWQLAVVYFKVGYEREGIGIYKKLLRYYKSINHQLYRIACLFNIAEILRNTNKMKLMLKTLESIDIEVNDDSYPYKTYLINQFKCILEEQSQLGTSITQYN